MRLNRSDFYTVMVEKRSQFDVQERITKQLKNINQRIANNVTVSTDTTNTQVTLLHRSINSHELKCRAKNDFFTADLSGCGLRGDEFTLEFPIFSLSLNPDLSRYRWENKDGQKYIVVSPSSIGRATLYDRDILIFLTSQMTAALNRGCVDAQYPTIKFKRNHYFKFTQRGNSGKEYEAFRLAVQRLLGTKIETNIVTGNQSIKTGFGLIESYRIDEHIYSTPNQTTVTIKISDWLFQAIHKKRIFDLDSNYFSLKPLEKRIYELARKHCGRQAKWEIDLALLHQKSGSRGTIYEFHKALKKMERNNALIGYSLQLLGHTQISKKRVIFYKREKLKFKLKRS
jgi:Replication initiator protein A